MHSLGIDIGYSAVKIAIIDSSNTVIHTKYALHRGEVSKTLKQMLEQALEQFDTDQIHYGAVTGSGSAFLAASGKIHTVNEVASVVEGSLLLDNECLSIIEMGGQTAKFITGFTPEDKTRVEVSMTSNCSSGTGSFLEEQVSRLGLEIEDYSEHAAKATFIPRIAGRCSVFAKTDIIHHQQEGVSVNDILAGLAHAVVKNYKSSVMRRLPKNTPILFVGGVCRNSAITEAMTSELKVSPKELRVHENSSLAGAIGAAILAVQERLSINLDETTEALTDAPALNIHLQEDLHLKELAGLGTDDGKAKHIPHSLPKSTPASCWLGIDVGSTSTNLVLIDDHDNILGYRYLRTAGDPVRAVRTGLSELHEEFGDRIRVTGAATTGSGRYMIGRMVGADVVRDEITAQARAAVSIDPSVDTIFEIGGQDSKFIALENGVVSDFQMNKICAAGTGSFIEEQSKKLGVQLEEIGPIALSGTAPVSLGERCTVFMETSIAAHLANGENIKDLAAGLCYSIVKNYMNRVVGQKHVGRKIFLQGGVAHNQGVVNAFRAVTGKDIIVPPFFSVTGAYGAAILARMEMEETDAAVTNFKGFTPDIPKEVHAEAISDTVAGSDFNRKVQEFIFEGYDDVMDPDKKTVGIPRALFTYGMFPMFYPFFRELGLNVLLSEPTSEKTIRLSQEHSLDETCYPVKLINGHAAELVAKGVDYLFFPDLYTVFHPGSLSRQDFGCAYMQLAFKIINKAMDLEDRKIELLAPTIAFNQGPDFMRNVFVNMGRRLGKTEQETGRAMQKAMASFKAFEDKLEQRGKETIANLDPDRKTFVLISKIYGVADPVLNLGIADKLATMGYNTLPFYDMPEVDIFQDHPNMYWPFGQHILEAAKLVSIHPNLYAVFLTHHGCGPDTVTSHFFKEIMGNKPYLTVEVDEHSSGVGIITRVEAFVNSLDKRPVLDAGPLDTYTDLPSEEPVNINTSHILPTQEKLIIPHIYPYSSLACKALEAAGFNAIQTNQTTAASIDLGRNHTITNEYYSLTVLLGDILKTLNDSNGSKEKVTIVLPQSEGAEVDGQYSRFIRTKLDECGLEHVGIISPYMEDLLNLNENNARTLFLCLLAGDLILLAPRHRREALQKTMENMLESNTLNQEFLESVAHHIHTWIQEENGGKTVFALGEPMTLYNDVLNNDTFKALEEGGNRVVYAPFTEIMWTFWHDFAPEDNGRQATKKRLLDEFKNTIRAIAAILGDHSHFEPDLEQLMTKADDILGFYAGAFGRYRSAKPFGNLSETRGIISVTPMYENTGISLDILHKRRNGDNSLPLLPLTFDGNKNKVVETKVESFLFYI
ncbi:acyl-CoA dehydratase activase [uncultured Pseudodesulfovibrio sp.]|uniref:acyl-CoA dehydratase activase n=1 Tax=uncultured Pseudodesulfovibrio sp. TaxID=2035858 RepID=UPI0029C98619|nr:acyl-CoA dehydratase activase [uncultured Pseudodesulfovibrio sp.]